MARNWKKIMGITAAVIVASGLAAKLVYNKAMEDYAKTGAVVLEYHSVSNQPWDESLVVKPEVFEHHLKVLQAEGYKVVTVEELGERLRTGKSAWTNMQL